MSWKCQNDSGKITQMLYKDYADYTEDQNKGTDLQAGPEKKSSV